MSDFDTIIGLEIHIQLSTASRLFSAEPAGGSIHMDDSTDGGAAERRGPNSASGPWSLGHPGTYPVLNRRAVQSAFKLGLAFECRVNPVSTFDRKHYFYPDLPRGYQITQQSAPICEEGTYTASDRPTSGTIRIRRVHLEEDAGRLVHRADRTLVDYDRAGVPLLELVTEPDFRRPGDAADFLRDLRDIVRTLQIGDGRMEDGSIRCDANISVRSPGGPDGGRVEIKNMNSFRHVEEALTFESDRQIARRRAGQAVVGETRRFDSGTGETASMRSKETAPDYRFIPEPDVPPLRIDQASIEAVASTMPERPDRRRRRFRDSFGLSSDWARILSAVPAAGRTLDRAVVLLESEAAADGDRSSPLTRRCAGILVEDVIGADRRVPDAHVLCDLAMLLEHREIASGSVGRLLEAVADSDDRTHDDPHDIRELAAAKGLLITLERDELDPFILSVIREHPDEWRRYVDGKAGLLGFFVGRVLGRLDESADPAVVSNRLVALKESDMDLDGNSGRN